MYVYFKNLLGLYGLLVWLGGYGFLKFDRNSNEMLDVVIDYVVRGRYNRYIVFCYDRLDLIGW